MLKWKLFTITLLCYVLKLKLKKNFKINLNFLSYNQSLNCEHNYFKWTEGRELAVSHSCKYIETSCAISHNVDFLLAGIGAQINLMNIKQSKYFFLFFWHVNQTRCFQNHKNQVNILNWALEVILPMICDAQLKLHERKNFA